MKKLLLFLLLLPGFVSAQYGSTLRVYSSIGKIPRPTALGDTVVAIVSGQGMVFVTKNSQGQYYLGSDESTGCLINTTTAMIVNGVLTITPRGGISGQYQSRLSTETSWSSSMTRTNQFGQVVVYVRDAVNISCETAITVDGSIDPGINAPSFLVSNAGQGTAINSTWSDNSTNETGFQIQYSKSSTFASVDQVAIAPANATSYNTQSDFFPGGQFYYVRIRAMMAGSSTTLYSAWSNVAQVTTNAILPTPANLAATKITTNSATLSWTAASGATSYSVEYGTNPNLSGALIATTSALSYDLVSLTPATKYYARITATSPGRPSSPASAIINFTTNSTAITLAKPTNVNVVATNLDRQFTATWTNVATGIQTTRIQYSTNSNFASLVEEATVDGSTTTVTATSTNISPSLVYYVRIRSEAPTGVSDWSDVKTVTLKESTPSAPYNLGVAQVNVASISYSWDYLSNSDISGFELDVATNATFTSNRQTFSASNAVPGTYLVTGLSNNTIYYARVRALRANSNPSPWSEIYFVATGSAPSQLSQTGITSSSVALSWTAINGASGYTLEQLSGTTWVAKATGISGTTYSATGLTANTAYTFRIRGVNGTAFSRPSNSLQVTTPTAAQVISPFTNVVVTAIPGGYQVTATDPNNFAHNIRVDTSANGQWVGPPTSGIIESQRKTVGGDFIAKYEGYPAGKTLFFRILAWEPGYEFQNGGDGWSETKSGVAGNPTPGTAPAIPTNVSATSQSANAYRIAWVDASTNEEGFTVQINTSSGFASGNIEKTTGPVSSSGSAGYVDFTGLAYNTTYYARVRSYNTGGGASAWTSPVSFTTGALTVVKPTISGSNNSANTVVSLSWNPNGATNITSYTLQRLVGNGAWTDLLTGISPNTTTAPNLTQDQPNSIYQYRVKTFVTGGSSDFSDPVTFMRTDNVEQSNSYLPTDQQLENDDFHPELYFTQKDYSKLVSPFSNTPWKAEPGNRADKPLSIAYGVGAIAGITNGNYDAPQLNPNDPSYDPDWLAKQFIPYPKRALELSQQGTGQSLGYNLEGDDPNTSGVGQSFFLINDAGQASGNIVPEQYAAKFNYFRVNINTIGGANANYPYTRFDLEHTPLDCKSCWLQCRQVWEGGKYRHQLNGGTDPAWNTLTDTQWFDKFQEHVTKCIIKLYTNTKKGLTDRGVNPKDIWIICYGAWGDRNMSSIWDRVVTIDGQTMPTVRSLSLEHPGDMVVGHYAYKLIGGSDQQWLALDIATAPMKETVVSKKPTRMRIIQVNDVNSSIPRLRIRLEDGEGNVAKDPAGGVAKLSIAYQPPGQGGQVTETSQAFLRSENDQVPDIYFDLPSAVDVTWWKLHSNYDYMQDEALGRFLARAHADKPLAGSVRAVGQVYPYMVQYCCIMFGTCGNGTPSQGQCEDNSSVSVSARTFLGLGLFRQTNKISTVLWQPNPGRNQSTEGGSRFWKGSVGTNSKFNMYQSLQRYSEYVDLFGENDNYSSVPFEISYDGGNTWTNHTNYLSSMYGQNTDVKSAAVIVVWNSSQNKGMIAGTPRYTNNINCMIRYTRPGGNQVTKTLSLSKGLPDGFYFERFN